MDTKALFVVRLLCKPLCVSWVVIDSMHVSPRHATIHLDREAFLCLHGWGFLSMTRRLIGKYLSRVRKLDHIIAPKEGFEAEL